MGKFKNLNVGNRTEKIARDFLTDKGLKFLNANWSCRAGEIDLVMQDGETRVFIEVRSRQYLSQHGTGVETVDAKKQEKLKRTLMFYQQSEDWWGDIRFDVISIALDGENPVSVYHIEYAF